jgi:hypothetical protein
MITPAPSGLPVVKHDRRDRTERKLARVRVVYQVPPGARAGTMFWPSDERPVLLP